MSISTTPAHPASITWTQLHTAIVHALRHVEPGNPAYITADVLTDELLKELAATSSTRAGRDEASKDSDRRYA